LKRLIEEAYEVFAEGRVNPLNPSFPMATLEGGPAWLNSVRYTINATTTPPQSVAMMRGPIMRRLLEERFRMQTHSESRESSVYILRIAKEGSKLRPTKEGTCNHLDTTDPAQSLKIEAGAKPWCVITTPIRDGSRLVWDVNGLSMDVFAKLLKVGGLPVVNQTELSGTFDIHLVWDYSVPEPISTEAGAPSDPPESSIASAIRKTLGLQLSRGKGSREFLVIDRLERPSEN
jgi:uncharacterized protein (TIGR03435 family)